jgi:uncharacterized membrane protein
MKKGMGQVQSKNKHKALTKKQTKATLANLKIKSANKVKEKKNNTSLKENLTFGQRAADKVTKWAGSWTFIILFSMLMAIWIAMNTTWVVFGRIWDPYPFILFNFVLSTLAALQAPIILMSQNRQAQKDRIRSEYDYSVNRKAMHEIERVRKEVEGLRRNLKK